MQYSLLVLLFCEFCLCTIAISLGVLNENAIESIMGVEVSSIRRFVQAMPIRYSGYHTCIADSFRSRILKALALTFILGEHRLMSRFHIGKHRRMCDSFEMHKIMS